MLLAMRLLSAARGEREEDLRTVDSVLDAAARRLGEPIKPAASRQLEANGVKWAWQMAHFSESDWDQLGVSLGLKTAAKAELAEPSAHTPPVHAQACNPEVELTDRMRRFLLLPDADAREAKPLGEISALFLGVLATPVADRQSLLLAICELMALVSGLLLSSPFDFAIIHPPPSELSDPAAANAWLALPTVADGMDALAAGVFLINFHVGTFAVTLALYVAASGNQADDSFCEGVMSVLGVCFTFFFMGVFFPILGLCLWTFFHKATSPYLMLGNVLIVMGFHRAVGGRTQRFLAGPLALELFHTPQWFHSMLRGGSHGMGTTHLLTEKALKAAAEQRAAKLRAQMAVDASATDATSAGNSTSPTKAATSAEARTRRHLRVIAME